jgi:hypothetical protein
MGVEPNASESVETPEAFEKTWAWKGGVVAGVAAAIVMGVAISIVQLDTLRLAIAGLYGFQGSLAVGWIAHLAHGTLFGLIFAWVLSDPSLYRIDDWAWKSAVAGVVYGLVLAVVGAGIIMPMWQGVVGVPTQGPIPNVTTPTVFWHAIYGIVLGGLFPFVADR